MYIPKLRKLIKPTTSIISNNCFGSRISQDLGYRYNSPTVGLFFYYPDYILFLQHLREFVNAPLLFREKSKYSRQNEGYPIGYLCWNGIEVEIEFLHYKSEAEAREKWKRRCERINWEDLFVQGAEVDNCQREDIVNFTQLPYEQKIFFTKTHCDDNGILYEIRRLGDERFTDLYGEAFLGYKRIVKYIKAIYKCNY